MISTKKLNFNLKKNMKLKSILYLFFFLLFSSIIYFSTPKLLTFSTDSLKKNLINNNNIYINNISEIDYKIFPTPRLIIPNSNFTIGEGIFEVNNSELEIILNISKILNFKEVNYKKLLINRGSLKINLNNINKLLTTINSSSKKLILKKNNIIFFQKNKVFLEISDALIKVSQLKEKKEMTLNGSFLNNKIFIHLKSISRNTNNLTVKMPELDIATRVFFKKNNSGNINGLFNLEIFNNFLKFNFIKKDNIKLTEGFIRSELVNTALKGEVTIKPNFFSILDFNLSVVNMKKIFPLIEKNYFSDIADNLPLIKKINGIFNFESKFEGKITIKNGDVLFEDFKVGKNKSFFFDAQIFEFGKRGKIKFSLIKTINYKKDLSKKIKIKGLLIPSSKKVIFENFLLDERKLSVKKTKEYESKFQDKVIKGSLANIFSEEKLNKYFISLF